MSGSQVPYSQRSEWADVTPLPVTDHAGKVVAIQYDQHHKECLGYFRASLAKVGAATWGLGSSRRAFNPARWFSTRIFCCCHHAEYDSTGFWLVVQNVPPALAC